MKSYLCIGGEYDGQIRTVDVEGPLVALPIYRTNHVAYEIGRPEPFQLRTYEYYEFREFNVFFDRRLKCLVKMRILAEQAWHKLESFLRQLSMDQIELLFHLQGRFCRFPRFSPGTLLFDNLNTIQRRIEAREMAQYMSDFMTLLTPSIGFPQRQVVLEKEEAKQLPKPIIAMSDGFDNKDDEEALRRHLQRRGNKAFQLALQGKRTPEEIAALKKQFGYG